MIRTVRHLIILGLLPAAAAISQQNAVGWVGTWATAPSAAAPFAKLPDAGVTLRQIARVSMGGTAIRIRVSNEFGKQPLRIGGATIANRSGGGAINASTAAPIFFFGRADVVIPPGAYVLSDRAPFKLASVTDVAVDLFVPDQPMQQSTAHIEALQTNYMAPGKQLGAASLDDVTTFAHWYFMDGIDVEASPDAGAIIAFGDSITDGHGSTADTNTRWPDILARRLQTSPATRKLAVLNEGISGNRLLRDRGGVSALMRFDRDVLGQAGVRYLIILEGINDIGMRGNPAFPGDTVTQADLTFILDQMIQRAHAHGIKVFGATLTPFKSAQESIDLQHQENDWIRSGGRFDGVIDFAQLTRDPADPNHLLKAYDFDNLHPGDSGYKAMGNGINLAIFSH